MIIWISLIWQHFSRNAAGPLAPFFITLADICLEPKHNHVAPTSGGQKSDLQSLNTLRPRQNDRHFPDDTFKHIFLNKNVCISIEISLKFVPKGPINDIPALVQIMAWRRPGDKPLFEPMMVRLPTHKCVTQPKWIQHKNIYVLWVLSEAITSSKVSKTSVFKMRLIIDLKHQVYHPKTYTIIIQITRCDYRRFSQSFFL